LAAGVVFQLEPDENGRVIRVRVRPGRHDAEALVEGGARRVRVDHADVVDVVTAVRAQVQVELEGADTAGELLIERELRVLVAGVERDGRRAMVAVVRADDLQRFDREGSWRARLP
jgi:hypothetical protein